ncbi:MAG: hypothetical protein JW993_08480 [Sedimentisphaerales bacterium]|nr:hypothetical protein [Sedimentisphaerales bacterium]
MNDERIQKDASTSQRRCGGQCKRCTCKKEDQPERSARELSAVAAAMIWLLVFCGAAWGEGRPGLLIIAHGSPRASWNQRVSELEQGVRTAFGDNNPYVATKVVFMEFAEPNLANGLESLQSEGCDRIVAVPLLIAPSSHSHWDIPALLGIYSDPKIEAALREEGARLVRPRVSVTLTTTLAESDVIERILLKRVKQLSKDPAHEAVVLLAHGSEAIPPAWDRFLQRALTYICGQTGISYGDWATVAVGQEYERAVTVIQRAARTRRRVIVVGAYLSLGVKRMHDRWSARRAGEGTERAATENPLQGLDIEFAEQGLLPDPMVAEWIVQTARAAVQARP